MPPVIDCRGVTKRFHHFEHRTTTLQEFFVRSVLRQPVHISHAHFQLRNFELTVNAGEAVALIGANGSGKSTALRLIAGIYPPTSGSIKRQGRLVAVIELGAAFHPELTGAENVRLYAAALGLTRREILTRYEEMVAFAELDEFIDVPIKYYSSGMQMRLAFSVAVCANPNVLLLDEILAVGDERFSHRCVERIKSFKAGGGTLVFVSHNPESVKEICSRAVWLDHGEVVLSGEVQEVLEAYHAAQEVGQG